MSLVIKEYWPQVITAPRPVFPTAQRWVVFAKNFRLDGAPDPRVAFGNGRYVRGTNIARLRKLKGAQAYTVPSRINLSKYNQVWLWCKKFNAPLAVARVK